MKKNTVILGSFLIVLSLVLHILHYVVFRDMHHLLIFLVADIAFIPLEVFFVSIVLDKLIEKREHSKTVNKINMIVGLFFQEVGNKLLSEIVLSDNNLDIDDINADFTWGDDEFNKLRAAIQIHPHLIDIEKLNLIEVDEILTSFQPNILGLITNQALQEHEQFTDLLMSITHLFEELKQRPLSKLSDYDLEHLAIDVQRVYGRLSFLWVEYLRYLQKEYPYLFLTAVSNSPYDKRDRELIEKQITDSKSK